jgi:hypothetical protein
MAIFNEAENLNQAIVNKVDSILSNTKSIMSMEIVIKGDVCTCPTIRYDITERILFGDDLEAGVAKKEGT